MILAVPIHLYRYLLSPVLGSNCRYLPGCSEYALDALREHGALRGSWLALSRFARCHPLGGHGYDPVPPAHHRHVQPGKGAGPGSPTPS